MTEVLAAFVVVTWQIAFCRMAWKNEFSSFGTSQIIFGDRAVKAYSYSKIERTNLF